MLSGSVTAVTVMVWLWIDSDRIRPLLFPFYSWRVFGASLLLDLLFNTTLLLRLLPWFSALLLRLIPSPRPSATDLTRLITQALDRSIYASMRGRSQHRSAWETRYADGSPRRRSDGAEEHAHRNVLCIHYRTVLVHAHNTHCNNRTDPVWHNSSNIRLESPVIPNIPRTHRHQPFP